MSDGKQKRASDVIADALIEEIRGGVIHDDAPLPTERELCERFEASRPTVREALAQLQMRGFAVLGAGKRPRAARPSLAGILRGAGNHIRETLGDDESSAHLEQMRQFIETGAVRQAARRANNIQIKQLQTALERNYQAIGTDAFSETDHAFHRILVSVVANPVLLTLHDMFVSELLSQRPVAPDRAAHDRRSYDEHRRIYQAILDGDAAAATEVMDQHLERSYRSRLKAPRSLVAEPDAHTVS
ncbi:FadR/GntR family transcriptional regulator [Mariluticola halotolerans]|uniref:FadR/GntR family transcriptional regulator n=1 Tax=Mariluticola halotolerans TaxID=2909283 RepID=UPI0026E24594|nr:FCD domain-containing protein [Mariluticola halotolerans]UJQ93396.1 FCD domain-containing protein [Mariluticola halotolerans]